MAFIKTQKAEKFEAVTKDDEQVQKIASSRPFPTTSTTPSAPAVEIKR